MCHHLLLREEKRKTGRTGPGWAGPGRAMLTVVCDESMTRQRDAIHHPLRLSVRYVRRGFVQQNIGHESTQRDDQHRRIIE